MKIRELYEESIKEKYASLTLLIEFLVFEKKVITFDHDSTELNLYFQPKHKERMNTLLVKYGESLSESA